MKTTRRRFLRTIALPAMVPSVVLGGANKNTPSDKLNVAGIGIGGMGAANLRGVERTENIVALCDVDLKYSARTMKRYPKAKHYQDYRKMFDKQKDIDAVMIGTPDHTHGCISAAAIMRGKHVFCQKPLTNTIYESRVLARIARQKDVTTQMGIQGHANQGLYVIAEWIQGGVLGKVKKVEAWCDLSYHPHGHTWWSSPMSDRPKQGMPVPDTLDWDTFIGPAPMRPYHTCYHPKVWRCWWDFGSGMMGDRGAHTLDPVVYALKLGHPASVHCTSREGGNKEVHPAKATVHYKFPKRGDMPELELVWREGSRPPNPDLMPKGQRAGDKQGGAIFFGEKGILMCGVYANGMRVYPDALKANRPGQTIARPRGGIYQDWARSARAGRKSCADFSFSGHLTEICLLGNVAKWNSGRELTWDGENMKFADCPGATDMVKRQYRKGWEM